ncbi:MAG: type II CRISPR-associated endonuclease Cas1 [Clostridiaceae bacterium]|nr:type II CRISPR-associated endonuclease Cas1 [Clostridiaceae bacterium]
MSWRTVVVTKTAKLDLKLNYLVIRSNEILKINLSEISTLIIESTSVSITSALLCEMIKNKIKIIFCDEKRNPQSELTPYYGSHDTSAKVRSQVTWNEHIKTLVWTQIVTEKIRNQKRFLEKLNKTEADLLNNYLNEINLGDTTNREGHSAKVYFNALFGKDFSRSKEDIINISLNYGYSIILSAFNREIVANGYITQLGLFHNNMFNQFNLSSDLMEPYRTLIDQKVYYMRPEKFERDEKLELVNVLNSEIMIEGKTQYVNNAIKIYCKSVFDALSENDVSKMRFYKDEL